MFVNMNDAFCLLYFINIKITCKFTALLKFAHIIIEDLLTSYLQCAF